MPAAKPPPKMIPADANKICGAFTAGANQSLAAAAVNKSERWLQYQVAAFPDLKERFEDARRAADGLVQSAMFKNATQKNNVAAQIFWAKNRLGWADRNQTQIAGSIDVNLLPGLVERSLGADVEREAKADLDAHPVITLPPAPPEAPKVEAPAEEPVVRS